MMKRLSLLFGLCAALAGCGSSDMAAMPIQGSDYSLTLVRDKPYLWSSGWDLALVVARMPDCMRRHHLQHAGDGNFAMEVYRAGETGWVLHQGKRWYVADAASCELQQFDVRPADPGTLAGTFRARNGAALGFVAAAPAKAEPPAAE